MDIKWYLNRLRAMSKEEILWRIGQKRLEFAERKVFGKQYIQITEGVFYKAKESLTFHMERLSIAELMRNRDYRKEDFADCILLLCGYEYDSYKTGWHAGFQTENKWPLTFSYDLSYKQKDMIGDARTNWELNRHFQFALLACRYAQTGRTEYLTELSDLFRDWNAKNPFLHGISWTSVMEAAIRDINWIYTLGFLEQAAGKREEGPAMPRELAELREGLRAGIINMTAYISTHYSRYSSANNHVIVEAAAMGIAGIVMECEEWYETAFSILQYEIGRQNYSDGVNKEMSLHYQSFFMEAVGLLALTMKVNNMQMPQKWRNTFCRMSRYVADCQGRYGETVVFGDDDGGKILDLQGGTGPKARNHYAYVLQLMSLLLPERYTETVSDRTLRCIVPERMLRETAGKSCYRNQKSVCYAEGGVSLLKNRDGRILIGIDHGALGFGSIAAHGHADALSFQMYLEGIPVFADAGTYIYHTDLESRNAFRSTENHNTVVIGGRDQSEILGAFLWGKRAETVLLKSNLPTGNAYGDCNTKAECGADTVQYVEAEHNGYAPVIHRRRFEFDGGSCLKIYDRLLHVERETAYQVNFLLGAECRAEEKALGVYALSAAGRYKGTMRIEAPFITTIIRDAWISVEYGKKEPTKQIRVEGKAEKDITIVTTIEWEQYVEAEEA